jgi:hypothetical protein
MRHVTVLYSLPVRLCGRGILWQRLALGLNSASHVPVPGPVPGAGNQDLCHGTCAMVPPPPQSP